MPAAPSSRGAALAVAALTLLALASAWWAHLQWVPGHDEQWHLWWGQLRPLELLPQQLRIDTHPPLSHLVLALAHELEPWLPGDDVAAGRLLGSMLPGALCVPMLYRLLRHLEVGTGVALVACLTLAIAHTSTAIAMVVRCYALATLWLLAALPHLLAVAREPACLAGRDGWLGLLLAWLAAATAYTAVLPLLGVGAAALLGIAATRERRRTLLATLRTRGGLLPVLAAGLAGASIVGYRAWTDIVYLSSYIDGFAHRDEPALAFLLRGTTRLVHAFTPHGPDSSAGFGLGLLLTLWVAGLVLARRRTDVQALLAGLPVALLLTWGMALQKVHPYGANMRHMYVFFPVALAGLATIADLLVRSWRPAIRGAALACGVTLVLAQAVRTRVERVPMDETTATPTWRSSHAALDQHLGDGALLLLDHYGSVPFWFDHRRAWRWSWPRDRGARPAHPASEVLQPWDLRERDDGGRALRVVRDHAVWRYAHAEPATVADRVALALEIEGADRLWMVWHEHDGFEADAVTELAVAVRARDLEVRATHIHDRALLVQVARR